MVLSPDSGSGGLFLLSAVLPAASVLGAPGSPADRLKWRMEGGGPGGGTRSGTAVSSQALSSLRKAGDV